MDRLDYLLTKLAEEATEVSQIALKNIQFTLNERYQNGPTNLERLQTELRDLATLVDMLNKEFYTNLDLNPSDQKEAKVDHYFEYSKECRESGGTRKPAIGNRTRLTAIEYDAWSSLLGEPATREEALNRMAAADVLDSGLCQRWRIDPSEIGRRRSFMSLERVEEVLENGN